MVSLLFGSAVGTALGDGAEVSAGVGVASVTGVAVAEGIGVLGAEGVGVDPVFGSTTGVPKSNVHWPVESMTKICSSPFPVRCQ
jgi:hypothetical protein